MELGSDEMRINVRLDEDHRRKLQYLMRSTGSSVSDIVKKAIGLFYAHAEQAKGRPDKLSTSSGFVGCGEGSEDLSVSFNDEPKANESWDVWFDRKRASEDFIPEREQPDHQRRELL